MSNSNNLSSNRNGREDAAELTVISAQNLVSAVTEQITPAGILTESGTLGKG